MLIPPSPQKQPFAKFYSHPYMKPTYNTYCSADREDPEAGKPAEVTPVDDIPATGIDNEAYEE